jgi:hypothetical protein
MKAIINTILVAKHEGKGLLGRYRSRWENNVRNDFIEIG